MPNAEKQRLEELRSLQILDTEPDVAFDRITHMVRQLFNVPIAMISLMDEQRQWFKSCYGINVSETSRDHAFCDYTIRSDDAMIVLDAMKDDRFKNNPFVTGEPHIRFYAGAPLISEHGNRLGTLCIIDSVARDHFSEQEILFLETLAAVVVDEIKLLTVKRKAEEATLAKSEFLAHMSHEIRTPLSAIIGGIGIFERLGPLNEKQKKILDVFQVASQNLSDLINNFLDISKIENSSFALRNEIFSYSDIFNETRTLMRMLADVKHLSFSVDASELDNLQAVGDAVRLRQILINLVGNAIKYTQKGSVHVRAYLKPEAGGEAFFICDVQDTGIGIAEADASRIFESFEQVDSTSGKGTGLGLAICRKLAQAMGGDIHFASSKNTGSKFTLKVPHIAVQDKAIKVA